MEVFHRSLESLGPVTCGQWAALEEEGKFGGAAVSRIEVSVIWKLHLGN